MAKSTRRKRAPAKRSTRKKTGSIKKIARVVAKQVLQQQLEDKYNTRNLRPSAVPFSKNGQITGADIEGLLPSILVGADSFNRIGDRIRPKRLRCDLSITTNGGLPDAWMGTVRFLILEDKGNKNELEFPTTTATRVSELLDVGPNQFGFNGNNQNLSQRINTRLFKVHCDKKLKLSKSVGTRVSAGAPGNMGSSMNTVQTYRFSVYVKCPASLIYQGPSYAHPTNFAPFALLGYANDDSNYAADPAETPNNRITWNMLTHFDYEDG